ncbi:MAG TPA: hemerythrin domain-containing protein [Bryobacteraceae bacterium]|nr:hemerythrin domain-containing protein [Bryobacteraceae bacterium]
MPVTIGATESTFANPIGLLSDCHRRIERFLHAMLAVATEAAGGPLDAEHRRALETALRYFREAAPKHTADEEEGLFPMLRRLANPRVAQLLAKVAKLEDEHHTVQAWHREADDICGRWLQQDRLSAPDIARLQQLLQSLTDLYRAHIAAEEEQIFPAAQAALSASEKHALGRQMAARRNLPIP